VAAARPVDPTFRYLRNRLGRPQSKHLDRHHLHVSLLDALLLVLGAAALVLTTARSVRDQRWILAATVLWFAASTLAAALLLGPPPSAPDGTTVDPMLVPVARVLTVVGLVLAAITWRWIDYWRQPAPEIAQEKESEAGE
jgi:hypothetical protein